MTIRFSLVGGAATVVLREPVMEREDVSRDLTIGGDSSSSLSKMTIGSDLDGRAEGTPIPVVLTLKRVISESGTRALSKRDCQTCRGCARLKDNSQTVLVLGRSSSSISSSALISSSAGNIVSSPHLS